MPKLKPDPIKLIRLWHVAGGFATDKHPILKAGKVEAGEQACLTFGLGLSLNRIKGCCQTRILSKVVCTLVQYSISFTAKMS